MSYYRVPPSRSSGSGVYLGMPTVTPVNRAIMIACGVVWAIQLLVGPLLLNFDLSPIFGVVPERVIHGWLWQPFTYMFLHSPTYFNHILLNMLMLWMLGGDLERHWGGNRYLTYYVVCGVGAGLAVTGLGAWRGANLPTIGASGAVYGLLLAYGMIFSERVIYFMMIFPMRARTMTWILFGIAFLSNWSQGAGGVSHIAHLGGMVVGFLYLKRAWSLGEVYREIRWRIRRRRFKVTPPPGDQDRFIH